MKYSLLCLLICVSQILTAQNKLNTLLNDTTGLKWREASVSWYIGSQKFLYRKRIGATENTSTWKRYNLSLSGDGVLSKTRDFTVLSNNPSTVFYLTTSFGLGREKRKAVSKALSAFKWYYGYELAPSLAARRTRTNQARTIGGVVTILSQDLDAYTLGLAFTPLAGLRYDFNARFSLALETGATASIGGEYLRSKDEVSFSGSTIYTRGYGLVYSAFTTPIRAVCLSYTF